MTETAEPEGIFLLYTLMNLYRFLPRYRYRAR